MILFLRKNLHNRGILQGLLVVTAVSMIGVSSVPMLFKLFFNDSRTLFTINGISITRPEFMLRAHSEQQLISFYKKQFGELASQVLAMQGLSLSPENNAQEKIIRDRVLASTVEQAGLSISSEGLLAQIKDPMAVMTILGPQLSQGLYSRQGILQKQSLAHVLQRVGLTVGDFEKMLEYEAEKSLAVDLARLAMPITQAQIALQLVKDRSTREYTITSYSLKPYVKQARDNEATREEIEAYFQGRNAANRQYWLPEYRSGKVWTCTVAQDKVDACRKELQQSLNDDELFAKAIKKWKCTEKIVKSAVATDGQAVTPMLFRLEAQAKGVFHEGTTVHVVMPTDIVAAVERDLDAVYTTVVDDYYREKAQDLLYRDLETMALSDDNKLGVSRLTLYTGDKPNTEALKTLKKLDLPSDRLQNMTQRGQTFKAVTKEAGHLITLDAVILAELTAADEAAARKASATDTENTFLTSFVENLVKTANIRSIQQVNPSDTI